MNFPRFRHIPHRQSQIREPAIPAANAVEVLSRPIRFVLQSKVSTVVPILVQLKSTLGRIIDLSGVGLIFTHAIPQEIVPFCGEFPQQSLCPGGLPLRLVCGRGHFSPGVVSCDSSPRR
jgi:hypothetical protein